MEAVDAESMIDILAQPSTSTDPLTIEIHSADDSLPTPSLTSPVGIQTAAVLSAQTPRKSKLRSKIAELRTRLKYDEDKKASSSRSLEDVKQSLFQFLPEQTAKFVIMQVMQFQRKPKGRRYTDDFKEFSFSLYFMSPKAYNFLSQIFILPSPRTLELMTHHLQFAPGLQQDLVKSCKIKLQALEEVDRYCSLCLDEMSLKAHLFYNITKDEIIGFEDIGNGKTLKPACNALVFMVRGIYNNWKLPIGYFFVNTTCSAIDLREILMQTLKLLMEIGFKIVNIISDMGSNFIQLGNLLGITPEQPFFYAEDKKIFYMFDPPHLIKATRNNFMKHKFVLGTEETSWDFIKRFYEEDQKLHCRLAPKLTAAHIAPNNFQKMKVRLAVQVLSATLAAAINTYISVGIFPPSAMSTVRFIERFNNLFDIFNSSSQMSSKRYGQAFKNQPFHLSFLEDTLDYLKKVRIIARNGNDITNKIKLIRCWQVSINSVRSLWIYLNENGFNFLLTRRLNQDSLENFFGTMRKQGGNARNPTPIQFYHSFKKMYCMNYIHVDSENCSPDFATMLSRIDVKDIYKDKDTEEPNLEPCNRLDNVHLEYRKSDILQLNSLRYICGYLIRRCLSVHTCDVCEYFANDFGNVDETFFYSHFKAYENANEDAFGNLYMPNITFIQFIRTLNYKFDKEFTNVATSKNLLYKIVHNFKNETFCHPCKDFPKEFLLKLYTRMRIFYTLKFINRNLMYQKSTTKINIHV